MNEKEYSDYRKNEVNNGKRWRDKKKISEYN